jgi:hypothetical protein
MNAAYEKRKHRPSRSFIPLLTTAAICLFVGAAAAVAFLPTERLETDDDTMFYNLTPTGSFYVIYAVQDIPCGSRINRDTALVTEPENLIFSNGSITYPRRPIWSTSENYLPDPYVLLNGDRGNTYAARDIRRDEQIGEDDVIVTTKQDNIFCPTPTPGS